MADTKINADGYALSVWFALPNYAVSPQKPTVAELNATTNVSESVAWENFSFGANASNQLSDPSINDVGNTQSRGFAQFGGTISFFYPGNWTDTTNPHYIAFAALEEPLTLGYLIIRADGKKTTSSVGDKAKVAIANDFVHIYKVISDGWSDVVVGENAFKYTITFQPQGSLWSQAVVATSVTVVTPVAIGTADYVSPGGLTPLGSYITGRQLAAVAGIVNGYPGRFSWSSSDSTKASVDANGVVTAIAAGSANIVATDKITSTASSALAVVIT